MSKASEVGGETPSGPSPRDGLAAPHSGSGSDSGSVPPTVVYPASCAQIGLYLDEMIRFHHFNITPYSVPIVIRTQGLNITLFQYVIQQCVKRHQAFRTTIHIDQNNNIVQHLDDFSGGGADWSKFVSWSTCHVSDESELSHYISTHLRHPFNLSIGPLFRCSFITLKDEIIVMMNIHHIIMDGRSTILLAQELTTLYNHAVERTIATSSRISPTTVTTSSISPSSTTNMDINLNISYYSLLPPLPSYSHIDYVSDETKLLASDEWKSSIHFWRQQLAGGMLLTLDLPMDRTLTNMTRTMKGSVYRQSHSLPINLLESMQHWCTSMNCSMYQVLLSCFTLFLHKLSRTHETDICFGSVCNNRYSSSLHPLIGYYVNTLPYRTNIQPTQTFYELQQQTSTLRKNIMKHQHIPFHTIVKECAASNGASSSSSTSSTPAMPFFQVLLTLEKAGEYARDMNLSGVTTTPYDHMSVYDVSMYDLRLHVEQHEDGSLWMVWHYATDIWDRETIHVMSERWIIMLNHLFMNDATAARTLPMHDISIIHPTDVKLVTQLNTSTYVDFGLPQCIHDIWLQHARTTPHKIAVSLDDINIAYSTLVNRASYVAHHLQVSCGVTSNTIVAQCVSRSIDMVVGIMAILLCGAIYCPLNPADPTQRLQQLINNTKAKVLLTQQQWKEHHWNTQQQQQEQEQHLLTHIVVLDDPSFRSGMTHDDSSPISLVHTPCSPPPSQVAYMIHTSGSTGIPKSALLTHAGFYNTIHGYMYHGSLLRGRDEIIANLAACSHDMHAFEIIGAMFCGAHLVMLKHQGNLDLDYLSNTLCRFGVTTGFMVPPVALVLLEYLSGCNELSRLHSFRYLYLGGDVVSPKTVSKFHQLTPHIDIYSYYGPAEITIGSTYHLCTKQDIQAQYIPLGLPMPNYTHYILDEYGNDIPIGGIGEICIGGPGVFAGYWNEPTLTQRSLVHHARTNTILYRTGDLGRMRHPDGSIYFCGRVDFQVKLRGQRVEMGEIEATIRKHQHVSDCIVIKRQHQQHEYLVAYIQPTPISTSDPVDTTHRDSVLQSELISTCQQRLAGYMVPTSWVIIPTLPHTANGKIDRKALPEPVFTTQTSTEAPTQTSTSTTAMSASATSSMPAPEPPSVELVGPSVYDGIIGILHSIWKRLLAPATDPCVSCYSLDISFFHCGGHSLAAMQLLTMIRKRFPETQQYIQIQHIFTHNTIQAQAQLLQTWIQPQSSSPSQAIPPQESKLAPIPNSTSSSSVSSLASSGSDSGSGLDIAIVGMDGCFPGAATIDEFWDLLRQGRSGVVDINKDSSNKDSSINITPDLDLSLVPPSVLSDPSYIGRVGRLSDIDQFDASYYGITAAEARLMDPQHRLLIEKCHGALQHAGIRLDEKQKSQHIGVYVACGDSTYLTHHLTPELEANPCDTSQQYRARVANTTSSVAQRIAFSLNLGGPALHIGTACSSSLSTLSVALDQLRAGRCESAVVGAAAISTPQHGYIPQTGMIFSPTGECRPFDHNADGTVLGYAVSAIVIKPLYAAQRDGDHIMAVIKGCGINNNGYTGLSFTAPSVTSQADCIKQAVIQANVIPQQISYIEAHGTATPLGDVVEMAALTTAFETATPTPTTTSSLVLQYCTVGSVKSNIGHTDTASGLVGLIKTVLCLEHQQLVPTLPIQSSVADVDVADDNTSLNPLIPFGSSPFRVYRSSASPITWKPIHPAAINKPLTAGVSSFGVGGTNVHVILQQYTQHNNNNDHHINRVRTNQQEQAQIPHAPVVCGGDDGPDRDRDMYMLRSLRLGAWSCDMKSLSPFHGSVKPLGLSLDVDNTDVAINDVNTGEYHVYVISGRDEAGLNRRCQQLLVWLQSQYARVDGHAAALHQLAIDLAYTLRTRTQWHKYRHTIIAPTIKHLIQQLTLLLLQTNSGSSSGTVTPVPGSGSGSGSLLVNIKSGSGPATSFGRVVLCIPGTTRNDRAFIRVMLMTCDPFREAYNQVAKCVQKLAPATDIEALPLTHTSNSISDSDTSSFDLVDEHSMRFATLYALTEIWLRSIYAETGKGKANNTPPYQVCVMGHSLGEYVAACVSGVLTLEEAVGLVVSRAQIITKLQDSGVESGSGSVGLLSGRMLACRLTESDAFSYVSDTISIAAINSVNQVVFAGRPDAISVLAIELKRKGVLCRLLPADVPFHSHLMEPTIKPFQHAYHNTLQVQPKALPKHTTNEIQFISTIRADWVTSDTIIDAQHWAMHLTQPVRFAKAVLLAAAATSLPSSSTSTSSSSSSSSSSCDSCFIEVSDCALLSKLIQPIVPSAIIIAPTMGTNTSNIDRAHQPLQSQDPSQAPTPNPATTSVQGQVRTFRGTTLLKIDTSTSISTSICPSPSICPSSSSSSRVLEVQVGVIRALTAVGAKHSTGHLDWNYVQKLFCPTNTETLGNTSTAAATAAHPINSFTSTDNYNSNSNSSTPVSELETGIVTADYSPSSSSLRSGSPAMSLPLSQPSSDSDIDEDVDVGTRASAGAWVPKFIPLPSYPLNRLSHWVRPTHIRGPGQFQAPTTTAELHDSQATTMVTTTFVGEVDSARDGTDSDSASDFDRVLSSVVMLICGVLGVDSSLVGCDVNFFDDLGGDSFTAILLLNRLNSHLQLEPQLQTKQLLETQTPIQITQTIITQHTYTIKNTNNITTQPQQPSIQKQPSHDASEPAHPITESMLMTSLRSFERDSELIVLRSAVSSLDKSYPPLFLLAPCGGTVFVYRDLVSCLPITQPVYAIAYPECDIKTSVVQLATLYNTTLQRLAQSHHDLFQHWQIFQHGIRLVGMSFGGMVAYEMAQQALSNPIISFYVSHLIMIDSPLASALRIRHVSNRGELLAIMFSNKHGITSEDVRGLTEDSQLIQLCCKKQVFRDEAHTEQHGTITSTPTAEQSDEKKVQGHFSPAIMSQWNQLSKYMDIFSANISMLLGYSVSSWSPPSGRDCRCLFFESMSPRDFEPQQPSHAWKEVFHNQPSAQLKKDSSIHVYVVPGNHISMNHGAGAHVMAGYIRHHLGLEH